jgi:hypothetical protein
VSAAVNLTAYAYRREHREKDKPVRTVYGVMTSGPEYMMLKPCRPLRDVEVPNFTQWVQAINGSLTELPAAPAVSAESLASDVAPETEQAPVESDEKRGQKRSRASA